jgi:predicted dehydrogenase
MQMSIRTIHIGVGGRGKWPIDLLKNDSRFKPVAAVDVSQEHLATAREALGLPPTALFTDPQEALRKVDADAAIICTPTRTHFDLCQAAFAERKHVLVEKGMTMDWQQALDLVAAADRAGVRFCVAQNYRYSRTDRTIRRILEDRSHPHNPGTVEIVDCIHHRYRPEPRTLNYPFAMVWDMGCHHVDSLAGWLGEAQRVTALSHNTTWSQYEHDANIAAVIEYAGSAVCHYVLTHSATVSDWRILLQGPRGALRTNDVPGVQFYPLPAGQLQSAQPVACELADPAPSEKGVIDDFYRYIAEGIEPGISGRNNLRTLAVCEMLVRSARDRRTVSRTELSS